MSKTPEELQKAFGFLRKDELDALRDLVLSLPADPIIVNIGAGPGTSTSTFLQYRKDAKVYSVDIQLESSPFGSLVGEQTALTAMGLLDPTRYFPIHGDSKEVGRTWDKGEVDLVFVDGDHSYAGAVGDITIWWPHLKPGGYMAVHDYERDIWPDVAKAVHDTLDENNFYTKVATIDTLIIYHYEPNRHNDPHV